MSMCQLLDQSFCTKNNNNKSTTCVRAALKNYFPRHVSSYEAAPTTFRLWAGKLPFLKRSVPLKN